MMLRMAEREEVPGAHNETSLQVRGALGGDAASLDWTITHFTPFLLAQARYRLSRHLQGLYDPEDLVQRVWAVSLPRLGNIQAQGGRFTPVLLSFLGAVLLQDYRNLLAKHMDKPVARQPEREPEGLSGDPINRIPASSSNAASHLVRSERVRELRDTLESLSDEDREIVVLHGIEQLPFKAIAAKLDANESTLRSRYHRALQQLKRRFPPSMIAEMEET